MAKFTIETKIQAATDYLTGQGSYKELARRYGVNHQVLQHWIGIYRPHGEVELRQLELYFYIAGVKSYGRATTFLMTTGYEQVRSIVAYLTGNLEAARRVKLELPETGVCNTNSSGAAVNCC